MDCSVDDRQYDGECGWNQGKLRRSQTFVSEIQTAGEKWYKLQLEIIASLEVSRIVCNYYRKHIPYMFNIQVERLPPSRNMMSCKKILFELSHFENRKFHICIFFFFIHVRYNFSKGEGIWGNIYDRFFFFYNTIDFIIYYYYYKINDNTEKFILYFRFVNININHFYRSLNKNYNNNSTN